MTAGVAPRDSAPHVLLSTIRARKHFSDLLIALALFCGAFVLYARTAVPGVLDGDQGEFQFMPAVLGIPHPSGFPLYILLGHVWSWLPIGSLAFRMNLFSGFWGALTVAALYVILRRQKIHLLAAFGASVALAVIPQFWEYSTAAAVYRLHDFLVVLLFGLLAEWERSRQDRWLQLAALTFGLDLANHLTIIFFAPAILLLLLLVAGRGLLKQPRLILSSAVLLVLPLLLYLYFPIRAAQLGSPLLFPSWPENVARGIVSPFYPQNPTGLLSYAVGGAFFGNVTGTWHWTPEKWPALWLGMVLGTIDWPLLALAILGAVYFAFRRARLLAWILGFIVVMLVVGAQYSSLGLASWGQFSPYAREYFLPGFILMVVLAAWGLDAILRAPSLLGRIRSLQSSRFALGFASTVAILGVGVLMLLTIDDLASQQQTRLTKRSSEIEAKWAAVKETPLEQNAILVGHWGDLTPLWYYQYAEGWRTDLLTIHPPDETLWKESVASGRPLYLAGDLQNWLPRIAQDYTLTPWRPLVRVSAAGAAPPPPLAQSSDWTFGPDRPALRLSSYQTHSESAAPGKTITLTADWDVLDKMNLGDSLAFLSLANGELKTAPASSPLAVNWLPGGQLAAGQQALADYAYTIPWGTPPGEYNLLLSIYSVAAGGPFYAGRDAYAGEYASLGTIQVEPTTSYPSTVETNHPVNTDFGGQVSLLGWESDLKPLKQGDTGGPTLLWKLTGGSEKLVAHFSLENGSRRLDAGDAPIPAGTAGQIARAATGFTVPADAPRGDYQMTLRVSGSGRPLTAAPRGAFLPSFFLALFRGSESLALGQVQVNEREHVFDIPPIGHQQAANFGDRIGLLGYSLPEGAVAPGKPFPVKLFFQARASMKESYKFFFHVVDASGNMVTQHDSIPGEGSVPTSAWVPSEVVVDSFDLALPAATPAGRYELRVGFYSPESGQRLPLSGADGDFVTLEDAIEVQP